VSDLGNEQKSWRKERRFAVLDPAGEPPESVFGTVYVADELLVDTGQADPQALENLRALAERSGWSLVVVDDDERKVSDILQQSSWPIEREQNASQTLRLRLSLASGGDVVAATPDAWALLRHARSTDWGKRGLSLDHVLTTDSLGLNPFKANPFKANPFKANPFKANPFKANALTVGVDSYAVPGFGGLQPVTYLGPEPSRLHPNATRPIVAVLDTGAGQHPWLASAVVAPVLAGGRAIGIEPGTSPDPESDPSVAEPLDGIFDDAAGHGTFIAGIIRQECPDALILPIRIADGDGIIVEHDLIDALGRLVAFIDGGTKVAVVNLSFSYYHETPDDPTTISQVAGLLDELRSRDCVIVCSAGNEASPRPTFPAAIPRKDPGRHVSVGALNPSDRSVALFSNVGDWVDVYAPGVSIVSILPETFQGGLQAGTSDEGHGRRRETLDVDDFRGGFGVWSGTSFAAPVVAGRIAAKITAGESPDGARASVVTELDAADLSRTP